MEARNMYIIRCVRIRFHRSPSNRPERKKGKYLRKSRHYDGVSASCAASELGFAAAKSMEACLGTRYGNEGEKTTEIVHIAIHLSLSCGKRASASLRRKIGGLSQHRVWRVPSKTNQGRRAYEECFGPLGRLREARIWRSRQKSLPFD